MDDERAYARAFADEHAHYRSDLPYWEAAAARLGAPVLDIGCASGRVALHLASAGYAVHGLDRSAAMLDELKRAAQHLGVADLITTHCADMRDFSLGRLFPTIIVPMNTFQLLHDGDDQRAAFAAAARHLEQDGELIIEVARPDFDGIEAALGALLPSGSHALESGGLLLHSSRYDSLDRAARRAQFTLRIDRTPRDGAPPVERHFDVRLFAPGELATVAEDAGLSLLDDRGGFDGEPPSSSSEIQLLRFGRTA